MVGREATQDDAGREEEVADLGNGDGVHDGTPFPTTYYLTCPRIVAAVSTVESEGVMVEMTRRLEQDADLAAAYRAAHEAYLADRAALGDVEEIAGISAGGMPYGATLLAPEGGDRDRGGALPRAGRPRPGAAVVRDDRSRQRGPW